MGIVPRPPGCIQRVDLATGAAEVLYTECAGRPLKAPNDLVFDATGSFWFTDLMGGTIHYAAADGSAISCALWGLRQPNGIGLSPDGAILYWAETATRQVWRRRVVGPGALEPSPGYDIGALLGRGGLDPWTLLAGMPGAQEFDSLAVDSAGSVCVGTLVESGITVISADGSKVERLTLPAAVADRAVTNICFGGEDLRTAYLTLSETGRLVSCRWPVPGLALAFSA
jgi:gluconolactonase